MAKHDAPRISQLQLLQLVRGQSEDQRCAIMAISDESV